jgi:hypothetical protein
VIWEEPLFRNNSTHRKMSKTGRKMCMSVFKMLKVKCLGDNKVEMSRKAGKACLREDESRAAGLITDHTQRTGPQ